MTSFNTVILYDHKYGCSPSEYEDAFVIKASKINNESCIYASVADGATESSFSQEWAKMLTRAFSKGSIETIEDLRGQVEQLSNRWYQVINRKPLPWYAEDRVRQGAFATLCGLIIKSAGDSCQTGTYKVIAVGDSCFFHVRNDKLIRAFPIDCSLNFNNNPCLLSSNLERNKTIWDKGAICQDHWERGDLFFLMTDAIAQWFLQEIENEKYPWKVLMQLSQEENSQQGFHDWVTTMRNSKQIKNDDTTALLINL